MPRQLSLVTPHRRQSAARTISSIVVIITLEFCSLASNFVTFTPPPVEEWSIAMSVSVCLSVRSRISGTTSPKFTKFSADVTYGLGSVLLWQR